MVMTPTGSYRTAFVEAFPGTFLRGEGRTVAEAEQACYAKFEKLLACPNHPTHGPWDRRGYTNGYAFCTSCGTGFGPQATGLGEIPNPDRTRSLLERALTGDVDAATQILAAVAAAADLPERSNP